MSVQWDKELHISYFLQHLRSLCNAYEHQDTNRLILAFFCIHGLALLQALDRIDKDLVIEWVYALQLHNHSHGGFRSSPCLISSLRNDNPPISEQSIDSPYDNSSIAGTYAALCILQTLNDDLKRVDKPLIIRTLRQLQNPNLGSFSCTVLGSEEDMRFVYCACAISYILDDFSGINRSKIVEFVKNSQNYDGSIGIAMMTEGQGGATFCAIAALQLINDLKEVSENEDDLVRWLLFRQQCGFQGRCNKEPDSCYAFWNGATLEILGKYDFVDRDGLFQFMLSCQHSSGGFCKNPSTFPDVMHSYYSLAWMSIAGHSSQTCENYPFARELKRMHVELQIPCFD